MSDEKRIDEDDTEGQMPWGHVANEEGELPEDAKGNMPWGHVANEESELEDAEGQKKHSVANEESELEDDTEGHRAKHN